MIRLSTPARRILSLALPMAGEQFLIFGVLLFDTAIAGRLGAAALSAQIVVVRWVQATSVIFNIMVIGGSILVAQKIGERDKQEANAVLMAALVLSLMAGIATVIVALVGSPALIGILGVEPVVRELGISYLRVIGLSFPLTFVLLTAGGCIRGAGDARTPLSIMAITNLLHVVLTMVLVFGVGPIHRLDLNGIAIATVMSRGIGMAVSVALLFRGVAGLQMRDFALDIGSLRRVWQMGSAVGGEQLALRVGQLVNLRLVAGLGTSAVAAYGVILNSLSLILLIGLGFMTATLTVVGQQVGAGEGDSIRRTGWQAVHAAWGVMGALTLLFFALPDVAGLFSTDEAVLETAQAGLRIILIGIPFEVVNQVLTGVIRGAGDTRYPMWITTFGHWIIRLPLILVFIGPLGLGLDGVWIAMIIEMAVRALLNIRRFHSQFWLGSAQPKASTA